MGSASMEVQTLFNLISVIGLMIGIGAYLTKYIVFEGEVKKALIRILVNVAVPCIVLNSIFQLSINDELLTQMAYVLLLSIVVHCFGIGLGWLLSSILGYPNRKRKELAILAGMGSTGFIGIPICAVLFGPKGALFAAVFDAGNDIVLWTVVVLMLKEKPQISVKELKSLINMPMLAVFVGLIFSYTQINPPMVFRELTRMLSNLTTPLAMLYTGMQLAALYKVIRTNMRSNIFLYSRDVWNPLLLKLIVIPLSVAFILSLLHPDADFSRIIFIQSATPTITMASIIFAFCHADEQLATVTTVSSTLISLITLPFVILMAETFLF
jgi:predicted permease